MVIVLATLLHVLVFVYWLGGDIGAFYSGQLLLDPKRPPAARAVIATILSGVDMAPRTALILALPTGLTLADLKGWLDPGLGPLALSALWAAGLAWLALAWHLHLRHVPASAPAARIDFAIRVAFVATLSLGALTGALGPTALPDFLRIKLALLAGAVTCGLIVRVILRPFGPVLMALIQEGTSPEREVALRRLMDRARLFVVLIWVLILGAAITGLSARL